jgi:tetratricopeptide (TPR) repeat protein
MTVVYPRSQIRKIHWQNESITSSNLHYSAELEKSIAASLAKLTSKSPEELQKAEDFLVQAGIFAIDRVRDAYSQALSKAGDPNQPAPDAARVDSLRRIVHIYNLKKVVPSEIEEAHPRVFEVLAYGTAAERESLLKLILPNYSDDAIDLALYLIKRTQEDDKIRSILVDMLRRMNKNWALLKLYNESTGQLKLIAAIALGKNQVLLGLPTIIEALSLDSEDMRMLAAKTLRELSGKDFKFRADGAPAAREMALKRWQQWWNDNESQIEKSAKAILQGGDINSPQRKTAREAWKNAHEAWKLKQFDRAEEFLKRAIAADPTFVRAPISLAVLYYTELKKLNSAEKILSDLAERPLATMSPGDHYWICFELGNVYRLLGRYSESLAYYKECLLHNSESIYAIIGKAECNWLLATGKENLDSDERSLRLNLALNDYQEAFELLEKEIEELVTLRAEDFPDMEDLPFERRVYNRTVAQVRRGYEEEMAQLFLKIGKLYLLLGKKEKVVLELRKGIQFVETFGNALKNKKKLLTDLRSFLGFTYEELGRDLLALREFQNVLENLDPGNKHCQLGLARIRKKTARKRRN